MKKRLEEAGFEVYDLLVPPGENSKSVELANELWEAVARYGFTRDDFIVACGGGVVGDLAGFVASTYMRGIDFIRFPRRYSPWWIPPSAERRASTCRPARTSSAPSTSPSSYAPTSAASRPCSTRTGQTALPRSPSSFVAPRRSFFEWLRDNADGLVSHDTELLEEIVYMTAEFKASVVVPTAPNPPVCASASTTVTRSRMPSRTLPVTVPSRMAAPLPRHAFRGAPVCRGAGLRRVSRQGDGCAARSSGTTGLPWVAPAERLFNLMKGRQEVPGWPDTLRLARGHREMETRERSR